MSVRRTRRIYVCPICKAKITPGMPKCPNGHDLDWTA